MNRNIGLASYFPKSLYLIICNPYDPENKNSWDLLLNKYQFLLFIRGVARNILSSKQGSKILIQKPYLLDDCVEEVIEALRRKLYNRQWAANKDNMANYLKIIIICLIKSWKRECFPKLSQESYDKYYTDQLSKTNSQLRSKVQIDERDEIDAENQMVTNEYEEKLRELCYKKFKPRQMKIFVLYHETNLKEDKIAQMTDVKVQYVFDTISKEKKYLKGIFGQDK